MLVDFAKIDETVITNFYDGSNDTIAKMFSDDLNRIIYGRLEPGSSIGYHHHENGSEIIYILSGMGKVLYDDEKENIAAGMCHYCPKGHSHSLINESTSDLIFFAVVPQQ